MHRWKKTTLLTKEEALQNQKWFLIDAAGQTLGRLASEVTKILRGKHKVSFTPHVDCGDGVIIVNAKQIVVTGAKEAQKVYHAHSGYMGGLSEVSYRELMAKKPDQILYHAIQGMMVKKSPLGKNQLKKLRIFSGKDHGMEAQKPIVVSLS